MKYKQKSTWATWAVTLTLVLAFLLVGCSPVPGAANSTKSASPNENITSYEHLDYTVLLPDSYNGKVTLTKQDQLNDHTIIEVYQTATQKKYPEMGFMFRIVRHTPAEFEDYFPEVDMIGGVKHFAKDENYYYSCEMPTDVQADMGTVGVVEEYSELCRSEDAILASFIKTNNLTAYDHNAMVYAPKYTYPGNHAVYDITLTTGQKYTLVLSQPIKQGVGGIWCVERMYDEYNTMYLAMPETNLTAMGYYKEQQNEADVRHKAGLLDAKNVALTYLDKVWGWADNIAESSMKYMGE